MIPLPFKLNVQKQRKIKNGQMLDLPDSETKSHTLVCCNYYIYYYNYYDNYKSTTTTSKIVGAGLQAKLLEQDFRGWILSTIHNNIIHTASIKQSVKHTAESKKWWTCLPEKFKRSIMTINTFVEIIHGLTKALRGMLWHIQFFFKYMDRMVIYCTIRDHKHA